MRNCGEAVQEKELMSWLRSHLLVEMGRFGNGKQEDARLKGPKKQRKKSHRVQRTINSLQRMVENKLKD